MRIAVVGMSVDRTCGVRDHAVLLTEALGHENVLCTSHWLWRSEGSMRSSRSEIRGWTQELSIALDDERPDAVLLHYSVFSYSFRGVPILVHPLMAALHSKRIPLVTVMHELVYPWNYGGWRGAVWAVTQRALLIDVMRVSAAVLVTAESRAEWLTSRRWLPRRPVVFAPVYTNLPPPEARPRPARGRPVVGLFGFSYQGAAISVILDAFAIMGERGLQPQLMLMGAPGRGSSAGEAWIAAAQARDLTPRLSFSGRLPAQELSNALADCDVLLCPDAAGPSSRKGTLAASVASGRPVIAIDGPRGWLELIQSGAVTVVAPESNALAEAIGGLLADEDLRETLGARGRVFAEQRMGVARTVAAVSTVLEPIMGAQTA